MIGHALLFSEENHWKSSVISWIYGQGKEGKFENACLVVLGTATYFRAATHNCNNFKALLTSKQLHLSACIAAVYLSHHKENHFKY